MKTFYNVVNYAIICCAKEFEARALITGDEGSLLVSRTYGAKFRSGNVLENGNKNRWNLPCGELLLSLMCTQSFEKNSLLHRSFIVLYFGVVQLSIVSQTEQCWRDWWMSHYDAIHWGTEGARGTLKVFSNLQGLQYYFPGNNVNSVSSKWDFFLILS